MRFLQVFTVVLAIAIAAVSTISYARDQEYGAKQINLRIDGVLSEWGDSDIMKLDQGKNVGTGIPDPNDFSGTGMIAWNLLDSNRIYFAATITDDLSQDIHPDNDTWWEDDSLEVMFDFQNNRNLSQWGIDANGKEISESATKDNLEWIVLNKVNQWIFEGAIDPGVAGKIFRAESEKVIGLAFHYNDCENGVREHQIGWTPGDAWDPAAYGDLVFDITAATAVEFAGKLVTTWASIKGQ